MKVDRRPVCPAWMVASARAALLAAGMGAAMAAQAQDGAARPSPLPGVGAAARSLGADMGRLVAPEAPRAERRNARDPFQTTPELRSRGARAGFAPMAIGSGDFGDEPAWRVQALLLGRSPRAVLVPSAALGKGAARGSARGGTGALHQRVLREGDEFEMPDGRLFMVERIDRLGVLLVSEGAEEEQMRIQ